MFTIQYEAINGKQEMQSFDGSRQKLVTHLARFNHPILAIYEQATVITKVMRKELAHIPGNSLSRCAREFLITTRP